MKKISLTIKCLLSMIIIFFHIIPAFAKEPGNRVTITGMISNIAEVGEYVSSQTSLRLYPCETTGKMTVRMGDSGNIIPGPEQAKQVYYLDGLKRLVPQSMLPGVRLPVFGNFMFFKTRGLEPDKCYKICAMMMDRPYPGMIALTTEDGKPFEFVIPEAGEDENSSTINVNLTGQSLIIPKP